MDTCIRIAITGGAAAIPWLRAVDHRAVLKRAHQSGRVAPALVAVIARPARRRNAAQRLHFVRRELKIKDREVLFLVGLVGGRWDCRDALLDQEAQGDLGGGSFVLRRDRGDGRVGAGDDCGVLEARLAPAGERCGCDTFGLARQTAHKSRKHHHSPACTTMPCAWQNSVS